MKKFFLVSLVSMNLLGMLAGCTAERASNPVAAPTVEQNNSNRYAFATERDPERGEVVKIFDEQTGDYWIKWVGTDQASGKVYSIWNYFPLQGEPKSGLTQITTIKAETGKTTTQKKETSEPADASKDTKTPAPSKSAE